MTVKQIIALSTATHRFTVTVATDARAKWVAHVWETSQPTDEVHGLIVPFSATLRHSDPQHIITLIKQLVEAYAGPIEEESASRLTLLG